MPGLNHGADCHVVPIQAQYICYVNTALPHRTGEYR